jgi:hypothetical protein
MSSEGGFRGLDVAVPLRKPPKYEVMLPQIVEMTEAGSGVDLISRALGIGAEVVREALHLHRTGKRLPGRVDGRRRGPRGPHADTAALRSGARDPGLQNASRGVRDCSWSLRRPQRLASHASLGCDHTRILAPNVAWFEGGKSMSQGPAVTSRPARLAKACSRLNSVVSLKNRTAPSQNTNWAPPGCRLPKGRELPPEIGTASAGTT